MRRNTVLKLVGSDARRRWSSQHFAIVGSANEARLAYKVRTRMRQPAIDLSGLLRTESRRPLPA